MLLILQVKTKLVEDAESVLSEIAATRLGDAVARAMKQFRAMIEAASDPNFFTFTNARGHELKVEKSNLKNIVALVVYGLVTPDGQLSKTEVRFTQSCFPSDNLHLFSMQEFQLLTTLSDTFPDWLVYLDVRTFLQAQNLIRPDTSPIDVWALATFEPDRLLRSVKTGATLDIDGLNERHHVSMARWEDAEKPSYFVDWLIHKLYECIGSSDEVNAELIARSKMLAPPGSLEAVRQVIPKLAMLRRRDRNELAISLGLKVERAKANGIGFRVIKFEEHAEAFIVLAIDGPRKDRQVALFNLARAAAYKVGVRHMVGIATEPAPLGTATCDVIIVDAQEMTIDQRLLEAVDFYFGQPQELMRPPTTPFTE